MMRNKCGPVTELYLTSVDRFGRFHEYLCALK